MISAGDLVVVVRPSRCGDETQLGRVFRVLRVLETKRAECAVCGGDHGPTEVAIEERDEKTRELRGYETWRLKVIDPDAEAGTRREPETACG